MAIEIIPKSKIKIPKWIIVLGILDIILLIFFLASYLYLATSVKKMSQEIQEKNSAAGPLGEAIREKEEELRPVRQKIDDFGELLSKHKKPVNIFELLEKICLPTVWFSNFNFSSETEETTIFGQTDSFKTLEHQILVLKQEPLIKNITLSEISMSEEGMVDFTFLLTFDPQVFK